MDDIPDAQQCEADDKDEEWPTLGPSVKLCLPPDIALSLMGSNLDWDAPSSKRSREQLDASSSKISRRNETEENVSTLDTGLDEFGLPRGDWEDALMDLTAADLQNAMDFPLAGWAKCEVLYGCAPPEFVLSKDSAAALLIHDSPDTVFYRGEDQDPL